MIVLMLINVHEPSTLCPGQCLCFSAGWAYLELGLGLVGLGLALAGLIPPFPYCLRGAFVTYVPILPPNYVMQPSTLEGDGYPWLSVVAWWPACHPCDMSLPQKVGRFLLSPVPSDGVCIG